MHARVYLISGIIGLDVVMEWNGREAMTGFVMMMLLMICIHRNTPCCACVYVPVLLAHTIHSTVGSVVAYTVCSRSDGFIIGFTL
jgi:hypothetical protein